MIKIKKFNKKIIHFNYSILFFGGNYNSIPALDTLYYNSCNLNINDLLVFFYFFRLFVHLINHLEEEIL